MKKNILTVLIALLIVASTVFVSFIVFAGSGRSAKKQTADAPPPGFVLDEKPTDAARKPDIFDRVADGHFTDLIPTNNNRVYFDAEVWEKYKADAEADRNRLIAINRRLIAENARLSALVTEPRVVYIQKPALRLR